MKIIDFLKSIRWFIVLAVISVSLLLFYIGFKRLNITTDILDSLPSSDSVISDSREVLKNHPALNQIIVDLSIETEDKYLLSDAALLITEKMKKSDLFKSVGLDEFKFLYPQLMKYITTNMPMLFSEEDLKNEVENYITKGKVYESFESNYKLLQSLEGVGQADLITNDPLYFRNIILKKLSGLFQFKDVTIFNGNLLSKNEKHLLIIAEQKGSSTDFEGSKKVLDLFDQVSHEVKDKFFENQIIKITPTGVFRAVYDNESSIRNDISMALTFASIGIIILVLISFRRPILGLFSLIPAIFGTLTAIFLYSLFMKDLSMLVLGFGGAIVSITVDHGIAFLLFVDKPIPGTAKSAAHNVKHIGLLAVLTTVGAFLSLSLSGFQLLFQVGLFAAMGILSSYLFIHSIYPLIFSNLKLEKSNRKLFLFSFVEKISKQNKKTIIIPAILFIVFLFNIKPDFSIDLNSLNSVSNETLKAEETIKKHWGNALNQVFLLAEGKNIQDVQNKNDDFNDLINEKINNNEIASGFSISNIFPGEKKASENLKAWKKFWNGKRINSIDAQIESISSIFGFEASGFNSFLNKIKNPELSKIRIAENFYKFFGIKKISEDRYIQISNFKKGKSFNSESFYNFIKEKSKNKIFDSELFNKNLGNLLFHTFLKMLGIISLAVLVLLFFFFADFKLTLISLLPILFASVSTIGSLNYMGVKIGIPGLMLAIIIFGMGIDYSIFIIRSFQRYPHGMDETINIIKVTVILASFSTLIGFGVLIFAENSLLRSIGLVSFFGIAYSFIGAFLILPPILKRYFKPLIHEKKSFKANSKEHINSVLKRYKNLEAYPRFFARFKIKYDPMFTQLNSFINNPKKILDIGAGFGVPCAWLLELYPEAKVYAIEPDIERARISSLVFGARGECAVAAAPNFDSLPEKADTAIIMDMIHYLDDENLDETFTGLKKKLLPAGKIIMRATIPSGKKFPWERLLEKVKLKFFKFESYFREISIVESKLKECGFKNIQLESSPNNREETWIIAEVK